MFQFLLVFKLFPIIMVICFYFMEMLVAHVRSKQPHDLVDKELGDKLETIFWYKNNPFLVGKP